MWSTALVVAMALARAPSFPSTTARPNVVVSPKPQAVASADGPGNQAKVAHAYNPTSKRDPFASPLVIAEDKHLPCDDLLCAWNVTDLTLVSVISGDAERLAMVQDPTGTGHIVRRNSRIGRQGGKVTQILRESLIVTEYWTGPDGMPKEKPVEMSLSQDKTQSAPIDLLTGRPFRP